MSIIIGSDKDLRNVTYEYPYLVVKYHNDAFPICQELFPLYKQLSEEEKYKDITFMKVNADENPIAQKLIQKDVYSFMSIYKKGLLVESQTISSEEDMRAMLDKLVKLIDK